MKKPTFIPTGIGINGEIAPVSIQCGAIPLPTESPLYQSENHANHISDGQPDRQYRNQMNRIWVGNNNDVSGHRYGFVYNCILLMIHDLIT